MEANKKYAFEEYEMPIKHPLPEAKLHSLLTMLIYEVLRLRDQLNALEKRADVSDSSGPSTDRR